MMKTYILALGVVLSMVMHAHAVPLRLEFMKEEVSPGIFEYEMELILDNNDNSWSPGQGWGWFVFGDSNVTSPFSDFSRTSPLPVGPWTNLTTTSGGHNGPTFAPVSNYWTPTSIGESLTWSGMSSSDLANGELLYSTIFVQNGAVMANYTPGFLILPPLPPVDPGVPPVPEPGSLVLILLGGLAIVRYARRKILKADA